MVSMRYIQLLNQYTRKVKYIDSEIRTMMQGYIPLLQRLYWTEEHLSNR